MPSPVAQFTPVYEAQKPFCYLFISQKVEAVIGFPIIILAILLLVKAGVQFHRARSINVMSRIVHIVYCLIFAWGACTSNHIQEVYCIKIIFSQILFWIVYTIEESNQEEPDYQQVSIATKYLFVIDMISVFVLQTILILVPYNWYITHKLG